MSKISIILKFLQSIGKKIKLKDLKWILTLPIIKDIFKEIFDNKKEIKPKEVYTIHQVAKLMKLKKMKKRIKHELILELIEKKQLRATKISDDHYIITGQAILDLLNSD
jgi:hypothetical protein